MNASPGALRELVERGAGSDRAFADALLRLAWSRSSDAADRGELLKVLGELRAASLRSHAELRERIASGALAGASLREIFDAVPALERDHFVEEVLGIAYPPLEELALTTDLMSYAPSGYDEIVYAFDHCGLAPSDRLLDLGAGLGKVVMLAALLTGARSVGIEYDPPLCRLGNEACRALGLHGASLQAQDARELSSVDADVVFMFLPFSGEVLAAVLARLFDEARRPVTAARLRYVCTGALNLSSYPELAVAAPARSWLNVYAWKPLSPVSRSS